MIVSQKCSDTVVGLELLVCLSTGLRCSLKRSLVYVWFFLCIVLFPVSSVLFNVATSCKQWIVKVAHKEESVLLDFLKENSNNKSVRLLEGIIHVTQNFCPSWLIIRTTSCLKRSFCYLETLN